MREMQKAAQRGDLDALNARIDMPALRESLRGQVANTVGQKLGDTKDNPFAALGAALGMALADQLLQVFVRPETIAASLRTGRWDPVQAGIAPQSASDEKITWSYERQGVNKAIVHPHGPPGSSEPASSRPAFVLVR